MVERGLLTIWGIGEGYVSWRLGFGQQEGG